MAIQIGCEMEIVEYKLHVSAKLRGTFLKEFDNCKKYYVDDNKEYKVSL